MFVYLVLFFVFQIREVRTEVSRYGGELSGIRAGIKRGIKLKWNGTCQIVKNNKLLMHWVVGIILFPW